MWGNCDPEEKSDNEKQDSASGNRPLQQNIQPKYLSLPLYSRYCL